MALIFIKDIKKKKDHISTGLAKWDYVLPHNKAEPDQKKMQFSCSDSSGQYLRKNRLKSQSLIAT